MVADGVVGPHATLDLWDVRWMDLSQIAEFRPLGFELDLFVPFARTYGGSHWAWWPGCPLPGDPPVVELPRDSCEGQVFAQDFGGFLCRKVVQELSAVQPEVDEDVVHPASAQQRLQAKLTQLLPYWPRPIATTVAELGSGKVREWPGETFGTVSVPDALRAVRSLMADERIGLLFNHTTDDDMPSGPSRMYTHVTLFGPRLSLDSVAGLLEAFGTLNGDTLVVPDAAHGPLSFHISFVPASHYNSQRLASVGLTRPPSVSIRCPVEGRAVILSMLATLSTLTPAVATALDPQPLNNWLAQKDPWGELRWAWA